ncbi:YybH family protein [Motilibacter peucedani]|uniref:YybH family protein n=1 Tax=Motilibacter peucedani TaxID=598650 RepID=UPI001600F6CC|nr:nuclear transport factor 2 family protein [Motilibacter peucedani]
MSDPELAAARTEFQRCIEQRDQDLARRVLHDAYALVVVVPQPAVMPRERWVELLPEYVVTGYEEHEALVDVEGDVAVVLSRATQHATFLGQDRSGVFVITDTWLRGADGRWRVWRRHSTPASAGALPGA